MTAGDLTINGVSVGAIALDTTAAERASGVIEAINSVAGQTGVIAYAATATTVQLIGDATINISATGTASAATTGFATGATAATVATGFATADVTTVQNADTTIKQIDAAISAVSNGRANLGAIQNRFTSVVANLATTSENLSASRSRILDAG